MKYQEEAAVDVIEEIIPLIEKHWEEIAINKDKISLSPDFERYIDMNELGILRIFTVRDEGALVGYFLVVCTPHMHYKEHVFAMNDILYVAEHLRGTTVAYRLLRHVENVLAEEGISVLMINMKCHAPFDRLLEGLGYTNTERVYTKFIGE